MNWKPKKEVSDKQLLNDLCKYAAYQERCIFEIEQKIDQYAISEDDKNGLIDYLIEERFVDEDRFVKAYVKGKFNLKKWGKIKIKSHLRNKRIPSSKIEEGLSFIDENEYLEVLLKLGQKKWDSLEKEETIQRKVKTLRFLASKGFESDKIYAFLDTVC
jgi:regulatory protein